MKNTTRAVIRKLKKMKFRTLGISLVVSLAMAMLVAGLYLGDVFDHTVDEFFMDSKMPDVFYELAEPRSQTEVEVALSDISEVTDYGVRLKLAGTYDNSGTDVPVVLYGVEDPFSKKIDTATLVRGEKNARPGEAVALAGMEKDGIDVGKDVTIYVNGRQLNLTISGLVFSPEYLFPSANPEYSLPLGNDMIVMYMDLSELQRFTGEGENGKINDIYVLLESGDDVEKVTAALGDFGVQKTTLQEDHPSKVYMDIGAAKMRNMFPVIAMIFGIVGFISIFMTIYRMVKNDSKYIGVMMSLGYSRWQITRSYLALGLILTVLGGVIGIGVSILFTWGIISMTVSMYGDQLTPAYPFSPLPFIIGWIFIIGSVMLSVWIPVAMVTRTSVREALDYKPKTKVNVTNRIGGGLSRVTTMGLRNSTRNPGRTALTIFVVGMTIGLAGSWLVMMDSAWGYMIDMTDNDRWDLRGDFIRPENVTEVLGNASLIGLSGSDIESGGLITFSHMTGFVHKSGNTNGAMIIGCDRWKDAKKFRLDSGKLDFNRAVVSATMMSDMDLEIGDEIQINVGGKSTILEIAGSVLDLFVQTVYTNKDNLAPLFPVEKCTGVFITLDDRTDHNIDMKARDVRASPVVNNVVVQKDIAEGMSGILDDAMGMLYAFFFINLLIAVVVAASAVIISTMERDVEFATMDTLGISRWKVAKSILVEMAVLAVGAAAVGVPMAYLFAWLLAKVMEEVIFFFPIMFAVGATLLTFVAGFAFVLLSSFVPIRYANKLDVERTIRERTAG
ncbi:MAG: ABC transporter permease [Thermoplasmatota archaeon]